MISNAKTKVLILASESLQTYSPKGKEIHINKRAFNNSVTIRLVININGSVIIQGNVSNANLNVSENMIVHGDYINNQNIFDLYNKK